MSSYTGSLDGLWAKLNYFQRENQPAVLSPTEVEFVLEKWAGLIEVNNELVRENYRLLSLIENKSP